MNPSIIAELDWTRIACDLDKEGYALLPELLDAEQIGALINSGLDEHLAIWRTAFYAKLMPIAQRWNEWLGINTAYPPNLSTTRDSLIVSHLHKHEFQPLQQNTDGERTFPLQLVMLLSKPGIDFTGGEFVMTEQRPRQQSRPMVLPLGNGDVAVISVAHRPVKGANGYYRVNLKHAISPIHGGERLGLELLLHDRSTERRFTLDQGTLAFDTPAITRECAVVAHDSVARNG